MSDNIKILIDNSLTRSICMRFGSLNYFWSRINRRIIRNFERWGWVDDRHPSNIGLMTDGGRLLVGYCLSRCDLMNFYEIRFVQIELDR